MDFNDINIDSKADIVYLDDKCRCCGEDIKPNHSGCCQECIGIFNNEFHELMKQIHGLKSDD